MNECWDYLRKKKVRPLVYESDLIRGAGFAAGWDRFGRSSSRWRPSDRAEVRDLLERMLDKLPEQDRQLLVLKEMEGFSVQELAEILDLNVNTVKVRLFRARGRIMDAYRRRLGPAASQALVTATERES